LLIDVSIYLEMARLTEGRLNVALLKCYNGSCDIPRLKLNETPDFFQYFLSRTIV